MWGLGSECLKIQHSVHYRTEQSSVKNCLNSADMQSSLNGVGRQDDGRHDGDELASALLY